MFHGKSNAFEISKKLGLDNKIIENAKTHLDSQNIDFEELLKNIYDNKLKIEQEKEEISKKLSEIEKLRSNLENDNKNLYIEKQNIIKNAKIEARNILLNAKDEANNIIKEINSSSNSKDLNNIRNKLNSDIKNLSENIASASKDNVNISKTSNLNNQNNLTLNDISINQEYLVSSLNQKGTVLKILPKSSEVQIQIGSIKTNLPVSALQKLPNNNSNAKSATISTSSLSKAKTVKTEINIIGSNVEEATFIIDKFLDDAILAHLSTVRIIHGKGTGRLREGIHQFLKGDSRVKSFRLGSYSEGEAGVTVVTLK